MAGIRFDDSALFVVYAEKSKRILSGYSSPTIPKLYDKGSATRMANDANKNQDAEALERDGTWKSRPVSLGILPDLSPKFIT
jgi:hypothetical protein